MLSPKQLLISVLCGLRSRLLLPVVLACVPLVILTVYEALDERRVARQLWVEKAEKLAHIAAREEQMIAGSTRQFLAAVAESSPIQAGNPRAAQKLLDHLSSSYDRYSGLGFLTGNGESLAHSGTLPQHINRMSCFHRAMETKSFAADVLPVSRLTSRPSHFAHPVLDSEGNVQGVVFASLDLDWLNTIHSEILDHLPKGAFWLQVDRTGSVFSSFSAAPQDIRELYPGINQELSQMGKGFHERSRKGSQPWVFASAPMQSYLAGNVVIGVLGTPRKALFAQADETLSQNLTWLGIATLLALSIGWVGSSLLVLEPIKALAHSSQRLASGDLTARTGLNHNRDELGQLTKAFDFMATRLEQREQEAKRVHQKLQLLSRRLVEVQESERRAIARELHDEVGQSLTATQLGLQAALQSPDLSRVRAKLEASSEILQRVIEQVHDLSLNLRPSMLDDLGLEAGLRWYSSRQSEVSGIRAECKLQPLPNRLDPIIETECFRIVQEALNNVVRHSKAKRFRLELKTNGDRLSILVEDDGVGFDLHAKREQAIRGSSLGLLSMAERASQAGGVLEIKSSANVGTAVRASFPLKWKPDPS